MTCIIYYLVHLVLFDDILKQKLEITMYIIIFSKKHQIIQQYKKQPKKIQQKNVFWWRQDFYDVINMNYNLHKQ